MKVKVCGMRELDNVKDLTGLRVDFIGYIFYEKSSRFIEKYEVANELKKNLMDITNLQAIPKVGVFVNAEIDYVLQKVKEYDLSYVQLHGQENLFYCQALKAEGIKIIKAFSVGYQFNFGQTRAYEHLCDYFLFDTKGEKPGGNGVVFDWTLLENYTGSTPFLLSGGIGPESVSALGNFNHPQWVGVDLNSRFESTPGKKEVWLLQRFIQDLREAQILKTELPNWD